METKSLQELVDLKEPAWPSVQSWIRAAKCPVEVLPADDTARASALLATQVTTRSPMGAIVYESGGLLVDHGWLRILGAGHPRLSRSLPGWNASCLGLSDTPPPYYLVADDAVGGVFALNGGGIPGKRMEIAYFAPDSLQWEPTGMSYTDFVVWSLSGDLAGYYKDYRWPDWERDVESLAGDTGFLLIPLPFLQGDPLAARTRRPVPMHELYGLYQDMGRQLADVPNGTRVELELDPGKEGRGPVGNIPS